MQHLRAVVRDLGRLAMMQMRDQACIRHEPWIGGQDAGHIFPENDAANTEAPSEQRR